MKLKIIRTMKKYKICSNFVDTVAVHTVWENLVAADHLLFWPRYFFSDAADSVRGRNWQTSLYDSSSSSLCGRDGISPVNSVADAAFAR